MDKSEVSQRAREAAADLLRAIYHKHGKGVVFQVSQPESPSMLNGERDNGVLAQAFARFERDILATRTDATPVAFISAERLNRKRELEANGAVVYDHPLGTSTTPLYTHPPATDVAALVEAAKAVLPFMAQMRGGMGMKIDGKIVDAGSAHHAFETALAPFTKGQNDE